MWLNPKNQNPQNMTSYSPIFNVSHSIYIWTRTQKTIAHVRAEIETNRKTNQETLHKLDVTQEEYEKERENLIKCFNNCQHASKDINKYTNTINKCEKTLSKNEKDLSIYNEKKQLLTRTIGVYRKFESENYKTIEIIRKNYALKWTKFESIWYKWNVEEVLLYFKYKTNRLEPSGDSVGDDCKEKAENADNINWDKIKKTMNAEKFKGKYLVTIDKNDLKSFGFDNFVIRKGIYQIIQNLCQKYPIPKEKYQEECEGQVCTGVSSNDENGSIDKKYICPLTNKLMKNPVIAFDGQCYEKEAIIDYFKKSKESPITKEKIDDVEWAISLLYGNKSLEQEIKEKFS